MRGRIKEIGYFNGFLEEVWEPDNYNKNLKMISLGVLFEGDIVLVKAMKAMLKVANFFAAEGGTDS